MPMLHGCSFPACNTLTLSTYCYEHDLLVRAEIEAERSQAATRDEPVARELAARSYLTTPPQELPSA